MVLANRNHLLPKHHIGITDFIHMLDIDEVGSMDPDERGKADRSFKFLEGTYNDMLFILRMDISITTIRFHIDNILELDLNQMLP